MSSKISPTNSTRRWNSPEGLNIASRSPSHVTQNSGCDWLSDRKCGYAGRWNNHVALADPLKRRCCSVGLVTVTMRGPQVTWPIMSHRRWGGLEEGGRNLGMWHLWTCFQGQEISLAPCKNHSRLTENIWGKEAQQVWSVQQELFPQEQSHKTCEKCARRKIIRVW